MYHNNTLDPVFAAYLDGQYRPSANPPTAIVTPRAKPGNLPPKEVLGSFPEVMKYVESVKSGQAKTDIEKRLQSVQESVRDGRTRKIVLPALRRKPQQVRGYPFNPLEEDTRIKQRREKRREWLKVWKSDLYSPVAKRSQSGSNAFRYIVDLSSELFPNDVAPKFQRRAIKIKHLREKRDGPPKTNHLVDPSELIREREEEENLLNQESESDNEKKESDNEELLGDYNYDLNNDDPDDVGEYREEEAEDEAALDE